MNIGTKLKKMKSEHCPRLKPQWIRLEKNQRLHQCPIPIIALTGGIATGKTTTSQLFEKKGIPVINADALIKEIYTQEDSLNFILAEFPEVVIEKKIDFKKLRQKVFNEEANKLKLESFLYKRMPQKFLSEIPSKKSTIIYDVPLLFEKNLDSLVDVKILVYTSENIQLKRLIKRDGISSDLAQKMLATQSSIEEKKHKVDFIIDNTGKQEELKKSFDKVFEAIFIDH